MSSPSSSRLVRLDGLRGVAVLSVLLFHAGYFLVPSVAANLLPGGFIGVDLFFVLSGFLMTNILLGKRRGYPRFYLRRVARIFPALYIFLAVQIVYSWLVSGGSSLRSYALIGLGLGNWSDAVGTTLPFNLAQTWSLGVEEQLYLLWPLVLVLLARSDTRRLYRLCLVGIAVAFVAKLFLIRSGVPAVHIYTQTEGRLDDFLVGALVAIRWQSDKPPVRHLPWLAAAAAVVLASTLAFAHPYSSTWLYEGGFTAVAASCGVLLYACLHQLRGTGAVASRPLRAIGRYSYSIYLWHPFVFLFASRVVPGNVPARVGLAAALLAVLSVASTRAVEEPLRRLAARSPAARPVVAGAGMAPPVQTSYVL